MGSALLSGFRRPPVYCSVRPAASRVIARSGIADTCSVLRFLILGFKLSAFTSAARYLMIVYNDAGNMSSIIFTSVVTM